MDFVNFQLKEDIVVDYSYIMHTDNKAIDALYKKFLENPDEIDPSWRLFFEGYHFLQQQPGSELQSGIALHQKQIQKEESVHQLIQAYRQRGHLFTKTNPVRTNVKYEEPPTIEAFNLSAKDLDTIFLAGEMLGLKNATLHEIRDNLQKTYCHAIGVEYMYIREPKRVNWIQKQIESNCNQASFSKKEKLRILDKLAQGVLFEEFLGKKFIAQKRFSLEGVEALIPALQTLIDYSSDLGIKDVVMGMAHRGRLNVLANILQKPYEQIFFEYVGIGYNLTNYVGDVKYHLGYAKEVVTDNNNKIKLTLEVNPSHLEAVNGLVEGKTRALAERKYNSNLNKVLPILIHGDAAISGQGNVYEIVQLAQLNGYKTGGTVHIVLNNQVGFTTNFQDGRSSTYCTDVAKVTLSPVFHVNGDDIEAVVYVINLALKYRQTFNRDVFIDIMGYRRYGHNEGDEPRFTQPTLYKTIQQHLNPLEIYIRQLDAEKSVSKQESQQVIDTINTELEKCLKLSKEINRSELPGRFLKGSWKNLRRSFETDFMDSPKTGVDISRLKSYAHRVNFLPKDKKFFPKIRKLFQTREENAVHIGKVDWATAELLAYASLLEEGTPIRISGQDSQRGTFSHRHAVVTIDESVDTYTPLEHISEKQATFNIFNSPLSEYGVLGFEYGFALASPYSLVIWEAQFGDFANTAQVMFDQFITSAESKWYRMNGLVLLLPHGFEGQGPEHSSARIERYLSMCADENIQIANCTTPANFFHILRRQMKRPFRKPLIIFTPKSLLRHPECVSGIVDLSSGTAFQEVIEDAPRKRDKIEQVLLCSGKIYYDLKKEIKERQLINTAIIRFEQLYPFPELGFETLFQKYKKDTKWHWVQEEPENMGAWSYIAMTLDQCPLKGVYRRKSASTATGFLQQHKSEYQEIMQKVFGENNQ
jgi:2-oxoglutarate dehydrogenase E1 component